MTVNFAKKFQGIDTENLNAQADPQNAYNELLGITPTIKSDIRELDVTDLIEYENQPFKPYSDEQLNDLMESINNEGQLSPIVVNDLKDGKYLILAGHNRVRAIKKLGQLKIKAYIKEVDVDTAKMIMLNSNLNQRHELLPSEKAFAYKMRADILSQTSERTTAILSEEHNETKRQIQRYIRLTYLINDFLALVDENKFSFLGAVELSYLTHESQHCIYDVITANNIKLSLEQTKAIRKLQDDGDITAQVTSEFLGLTSGDEKPKSPKIKTIDTLEHDTYAINNKQFEYLNNIEYINDSLNINKKTKAKLIDIEYKIKKEIDKINALIQKEKEKYNSDGE